MDILEAAKEGSYDMLESYLKNGSDPNIRDKYGMTPLIASVRGGHTECLQLLLRHGAKPNIQDNMGDTALIMAARLRSSEHLKILMRHGANPNVQAVGGHTALMLIANQGITGCLKLLLNADDSAYSAREAAYIAGFPSKVYTVNPNLQDLEGRTALARAVGIGHAPSVKILLGAGADPNIADCFGFTALMWAAMEGKKDCLQLLLNAGADGESCCRLARINDECNQILKEWTEISHA